VKGGESVLTKENILRLLPSVDELARWWEEAEREHFVPLERSVVISLARELTKELREKVLADKLTCSSDLSKEKLLASLAVKIIGLTENKLDAVINATGVVLHTNLGRAVLSESGAAAVARLAASYSNLELDLASGERGSRYSHVEGYLCKLTGAEAALVVNNNAAAVLLALAALAKGQEAIVSRGELVEIGGSFRIPEVMAQSGARLVEVGTTNKTYPADYAKAISENTALLLKVHTSNYRIVGYTRETTREELVELGQKHRIPVMEDLGSGCLVDLRLWGISGEPTVQQCLAAGVDVVTFSGDKLLGGPQAGIIAGSKEIIGRLKKHPLTRALRIDKFTIAALEATLKEYLNNTPAENIPTLKMLTASLPELAARAGSIAARLEQVLAEKAGVAIEEGISMVGGGALPTAQLPGAVIGIKPLEISCNQAAKELRLGKNKVIVRVQDDRLLVDLRTVFPSQEENLIEKLVETLRGEI
jgi:L-seryl-tRNA(Ser) seleniumtransferase